MFTMSVPTISRDMDHPGALMVQQSVRHHVATLARTGRWPPERSSQQTDAPLQDWKRCIMRVSSRSRNARGDGVDFAP